jgi:hypothetical protein
MLQYTPPSTIIIIINKMHNIAETTNEQNKQTIKINKNLKEN